MIEALKAQTPEMKATIACMAVSQEVSIDGTISRGQMMNRLTKFFVEDLNAMNIEEKPVGRGNVPRTFSESTCKQIPSSMKRVAESGLIDGEFIIVKRGKNDNIISRMNSEECMQNADVIMETLEDRITGNLSKEETKRHFEKKVKDREKAIDAAKKGSMDPSTDLYVYPTKTWLKETDGALEFYRKKSGLDDIDKVAEWLVKERFLEKIVADEQKVEIPENSKHFDEENQKVINKLNEVTEELKHAIVESARRREEMTSGVQRL